MNNPLRYLAAAAMLAVALSSCDTLEPGEAGNLVPPTVDEDPSLPAIDVNGTRLHAETFGNPADPMIVVLHGGPGGDYRSLLRCSRFSDDGFFVVFYDQRGSGLSRRHNREIYSIQLFIDDLEAVIGHYRRSPQQKVVLMGLSWGAMLATAYVNEHPADIDGLVVMEPGGLTWPDAKEYIRRTRSGNVFGEAANDYVYLDQMLTAGDHNTLDYRAALQSAADFAEGNRVGNAGPYPFWRKGAVCSIAAADYARDHSFDFTTNLRQFTTRVLFVYSELNEAYGTAYAGQVSAAYPHVQLVRVAGTGHEIPWFGWEAFASAARPYLATIR
jgi:proline iminopeptidase